MNRQIRFRVWDIKGGNWLNPDHTQDGAGITFKGEVAFCSQSQFGYVREEHKDRFVIQQFTGVKDKNGREVFEGDILKFKTYDGWKDDFGRYVFLEVRYHELTASFRMTRCDTYRGDSFDYSDKPKEVEVVGNIFENPELLIAPAIDLKVHSVYLDSDGSIYCYDKDGKDVEYPVAWPEKIENLVKFMDRQGIAIRR
jgi:uncharacterized phage protein (TIGR01671 family)